MLYSGFPYTTTNPKQSSSNGFPSNHIQPIPTTTNYNPITSGFSSTQHYSFHEFYTPPPTASTNLNDFNYPVQAPLLFHSYTPSDGVWTGQQLQTQPPTKDLKEEDEQIDNKEKIVTSPLQTEDESYSASPQFEPVFKSALEEKRYRERRQKNNEAAKQSRSKRRERENVLRLRVDQLEAENRQLRQELKEAQKKCVKLGEHKRVLMSSENTGGGNRENTSYMYIQ